MNRKEIVNALRVIKYVCYSQGTLNCCQKCPLGNSEGDCLVMKNCPDDWKFTDENKILQDVD